MPDGPRYDDDFYGWIIARLLKLEYSPAGDPRFDWMASIEEARQAIADRITVTLQRDGERKLPQVYADGRDRAELGLRKFGATAAAGLPPLCPNTLEQIGQRGWYPEAA